MTDSSRYQARGVSSTKSEVHDAIANVDAGLYPKAFCKIVPDFLGQNPAYCNIMHADGAGTKSVIAYLYYKETGRLDIFKHLAQDAVVMNTDDLLCVGAVDHLLFSSTIARNAKLIPGEVLKALIEGMEEVLEDFRHLGFNFHSTGGETEDVGDAVRSLMVNVTVTARLKRSDILDSSKIKAGDIIYGLGSCGQSHYEKNYNSGIGSNGLTSARHELLSHYYADQYPESMDPKTAKSLVYAGPYRLTDPLEHTPLTIGEALLSPTRTYAPLVRDLLNSQGAGVSAILHCSGGGQTKCLRFGENIRYRKNNLFSVPPLFAKIQASAGTSWQEMYQVFNMGHRLEIIGSAALENPLRDLGLKYGIDVKAVGYCEASEAGNQLIIESPQGELHYAL